MKKILFIICFITTIIASFPLDSLSSSIWNEEAEEYIQRLNSDFVTVRIRAARDIFESAIPTEKLYDEVAKRLLIALDLESSENKHVDELAWLCKALAASGDDKHKGLLSRVHKTTGNDKIKRHANYSLHLIEEYKKMNANSSYDATLSPEENRLADLLRSDVSRLVRHGAKIIREKRQVSDKLYLLIYTKLVEKYDINLNDSDLIDEVVWLCRALATSGYDNYINILERIHESTSNKKVKKYANESLIVLEKEMNKNAILNSMTIYNQDFTIEENEIVTLLKSENSKLKRDGAMIVYKKEKFHKEIYEIIDKELKNNYKNNPSDAEHIDAMAWLCKALSISKDIKYIETLKEVRFFHYHPKIKKAAAIGIDRLSGSE